MPTICQVDSKSKQYLVLPSRSVKQRQVAGQLYFICIYFLTPDLLPKLKSCPFNKLL